MNSREALKRLKQETVPATYMPDFDKDKCIEIIKKDLDKLETLEKIIKENFGYNESTKECFFNYNAPVMEEEIKQMLESVGDSNEKINI